MSVIGRQQPQQAIIPLNTSQTASGAAARRGVKTYIKENSRNLLNVLYKCPICWETVRVPVVFRCFPCCKPGRDGRSKCTLGYVCLHCARRYLFLNVARQTRPASVRCMSCEETVNPQKLRSALNCYRVDERAMRSISLLAKEAQMTFKCWNDCGAQFADQHELWEHINPRGLRGNNNNNTTEIGPGRCPNSLTTCPYNCGRLILVREVEGHLTSCPHRPLCLFCGETYRTYAQLGIHLAACPRAPVPCPLGACAFHVKREDLRKHVVDHMRSFAISMSIATEMLDKDVYVGSIRA